MNTPLDCDSPSPATHCPHGFPGDQYCTLCAHHPRPAAEIPNAYIARRLKLLRALKPGWDHEGAAAIDPKAIRDAREFLKAIANTALDWPSVVPTVRGGVQLEWHTQRLEGEIEFMPGIDANSQAVQAARAAIAKATKEAT
jgi:hypothetical protein